MWRKHPRQACLATLLAAIVAWAMSVLFLPVSWLQPVISLPFLLIMPGYLLWWFITGLSLPSPPPLRRLLYYAGLSLLTLMGSGLLLNEAYDILGLSRPLSTIPLTVMLSGICSLLAVGACLRAPVRSPRIPFNRTALLKYAPFIATCVLLPLLAIAGALTLNNGGTGGVALLTFAAIAGLFLLFFWRSKDMQAYYPWFLFSVALSLLLGTSLRGWNITGHDVMQEYQVYQLTLQHAAWHMNYYQDAYMACLSITILPTMLQRLTHISDPYIYKFVFQLFFALIGPVLYETMRPFVSRRIALLAAFLFVTFPTFLTDIMMLNRQETAFLFLGLALLAAVDKRLNRTVKSALAILFLIGMVVSHYSTSYEAIGTFIIATLLGYVWMKAQRRRSPKQAPAASRVFGIFSIPIVLGTAVLLIGWGSIATETTSNISQTVQALSQSLSTELHHSSAAPVVKPSLIQFASDSRKGEDLPGTAFYSTKTTLNYPLKASSEVIESPTQAAKLLKLPGKLVSLFYQLIRSFYELLIAAAIPASVGLLLRRKHRRRLPFQYVLLVAGAFIMIGAELAFPQAVNYGLARAIQQSLVFAALPIVLLLVWLVRCLRVSVQTAEKIVAGLLVTFFLILSGFLPALTGNAAPQLALSNSGLYYNAYYTHQEEIAAAQWLDTNTPKGSMVSSDEFARRKLIAYANIFSQPTLAPSAIPKDSYVFLSYGNTKYNQVPVYDGSALLYYQPPTAFLNANKNEVFSSTNVQIYK